MYGTRLKSLFLHIEQRMRRHHSSTNIAFTLYTGLTLVIEHERFPYENINHGISQRMLFAGIQTPSSHIYNRIRRPPFQLSHIQMQ